MTRRRSCSARRPRTGPTSTRLPLETWRRWLQKWPIWTVACTTWATRQSHGSGTATFIYWQSAGRRSPTTSVSRASTIRRWRTGPCRCATPRKPTRARTSVRCQRRRPSASWCTCPSSSRSRQSWAVRICTSTPGPLSTWRASCATRRNHPQTSCGRTTTRWVNYWTGAGHMWVGHWLIKSN